MTVKRVSPQEAKRLMEERGYVYVDVRSIPEFEQGHPQGAYNVPLLHMTPGGMQPNPDFLDVFQALFSKGDKVVVGCRSGGRSLRAAQQLQQLGYTDVVDQRAGFGGATNAFGQKEEEGWQEQGLPVATAPEEGRSYEELARRAGKG
ncbi:MAG: rhodanese-like domain-containing protein [Myxococcota bacterium]